jgi:hypothetical protein
MTSKHTDICLPPLMLQTLEGVKKVPLFPKAGQGFDPDVVKSHSTVTVAYDAHFRIILYCPKGDKHRPHKSIKLYHEQLHATAMSSLVLRNLPRPPSTDTEAMQLSSDGIPAVTGRTQTLGNRSRKRDRDQNSD